MAIKVSATLKGEGSICDVIVTPDPMVFDTQDEAIEAVSEWVAGRFAPFSGKVRSVSIQFEETPHAE